MLNELQWSLASAAYPPEGLIADGAGYRDLQLQHQKHAVPLTTARERRRVVTEYFQRLQKATAVVITLGLTEAWYDRLTELYLNVAPPYELAKQYPGRFAVRLTDYAENRRYLESVCQVLRRFCRPNLKIIVTTSPVPLHRTFTGVDGLVQNTYAKAVLRVVAGDVAAALADVEYFPAYELVTAAPRYAAYFDDQVHVSVEMQELVGAHFLNAFGISIPRPHPEYNEPDYLTANPDVRAAVSCGHFGSGYEHWLSHGRLEHRPLSLPMQSQGLTGPGCNNNNGSALD